MTVQSLEERLALLENPPPKERNSEGWLILGVIVCSTVLATPWVGVLSGTEWTALVTVLTSGYTAVRFGKKIKEVRDE